MKDLEKKSFLGVLCQTLFDFVNAANNRMTYFETSLVDGEFELNLNYFVGRLKLIDYRTGCPN